MFNRIDISGCATINPLEVAGSSGSFWRWIFLQYGDRFHKWPYILLKNIVLIFQKAD